jgi:FtsP/CotA-like multicopper oxidase with cupredoxin domain
MTQILPVLMLGMLVAVSAVAQIPMQEIPQPKTLRSVDGVLTDTLRLQMARLPIAGRMIEARTYNGASNGSTWRVRRGETLRVHLDNQLPRNPDADLPKQGNFPERANTTNLHVHGLNVTPKGNGDNVLLAIEPGESFDFSFALPEDHSVGTNWYHPHHHTSTFPQIVNGLAGTIVIEDPTDPSKTDPALSAMDDRVFVFTSYFIDTVTNTIPYPPRLTASTAFAPQPGIETPVHVNGVLSGKLSMRPGEIQRWRLVNATYELGIRLVWKRIAASDTTPVVHMFIANDGLYLSKANPTSAVTFTSGARADVLVSAPIDDATYIVELQTLDRTMTVIETRIMATITRDGSPVEPAMSMPATLPKAIQAGSIRDEEITGTRELVFRIGDVSKVQSDSSAIMRTFTIDDSPFNHDVVNITVQAGDVEEWTIRNDSRGYHPFHIHVNEFLVVEENGVRIEDPIWHDVLLLEPLKTYKIRHRFGDYDGKTVLHCHFLPHEDWGMMQLIDILPKTSSVDTEPWNEPIAFPNPVAGRLQSLSVPLPTFLGDHPLTVTLFNAVGHVVQSTATTAAATPIMRLDVSKHPAGTYYVRIDDGRRFVMNEMVVLVR